MTVGGSCPADLCGESLHGRGAPAAWGVRERAAQLARLVVQAGGQAAQRAIEGGTRDEDKLRRLHSNHRGHVQTGQEGRSDVRRAKKKDRTEND